jgi:bacteriocin biosynthesis cyclodehydratase domain-containing protein
VSEQGSDLPTRPYVKPWYRIAEADDRMVLEYGGSTVVLEGKAVAKLLPLLLPLLDGSNDLEQISEKVGEAAAPAVMQTIRMLSENGVLTDGPPVSPDSSAAATETVHYLSAITTDQSVSASEDLLRAATVSIAGSGTTAQQIAELLRSAGVTGTKFVGWDPAPKSPPDLALAVPEPGELPKLETYNLAALESGTPWLQVLPFDGRMLPVGPLYVPGETCCFECYRRRRVANVSFPDQDFWALEASPASYPTPPPLRSIAAGLVATLALRWLSERVDGGPSSVPARMYGLKLSQPLQLESHYVYRVPRCPICFPDELGTPNPWHG